MELKKAIEIMCNTKNGTIGSIEYDTDCTSKVSAKFRKGGVKVVKHTERLCRYGIDYSNVSEVKELKEAGVLGNLDHEYNWEWMDGLKEKIAHNTKTGTDALRIIVLRNANAKYSVKYRLTKETGETVITDKDGIAPYMVGSFFNTNGGEPPVTQWIKVENIRSINGKS